MTKTKVNESYNFAESYNNMVTARDAELSLIPHVEVCSHIIYCVLDNDTNAPEGELCMWVNEIDMYNTYKTTAPFFLSEEDEEFMFNELLMNDTIQAHIEC